MSKTKTKNIFDVKKIRKRKKNLPRSKQCIFKKILRRHNIVFRRITLVIATVLGMWLIYNYQQFGSYLFKASVLDTPPVFTGTVYPVDKVPDWTNWKGDNHTTPYSAISQNMLVALPSYDVEMMQFPNEDLIWGNANHDVIRNTKITYPVVYLGSYQLDHKENVGSHPAVDIKMPVGTPIKSIANGRVIKVSMKETGFGHHVVIQHYNVPDPRNPGKKTNLFSAFNHMDKISVTEGQEVYKGQLIGTSGNTGTSTTPHLHFQIDTSSAPWHPYWPFSWAESQEAGLSFFEAVNAGLGLSNAKQNTINPMNYVSSYINYTDGGSSSGSNSDSSNGDDLPSDNTTPVSEEDQTPSVEDIEEAEEVIVLDTPDITSGVDTSLFSFNIVGEKTSMVGNGLTITAIDESGQIDNMSDSDEVKVTISGVGRLSKKTFRKVDFKNNAIKLVVNSSEPGTARVEVGKTLYEINFINEVKPISSIAVEHDGNFQNGQVEVIKLIALDSDGIPTPVVNFGGTLEINAKEGTANFTPDRIAVSDFKNGVAEVKMRANNDGRVVIRVHGGAIVGESDSIYSEPTYVFGDVQKGHPNYDAIKYLEEYNIIGGYNDGTFKPEKTVNRVEALKMLMLAFNIEAGPGGELPFADTEDNAWYASTLSTAVDQGIVKGYADMTFKPGSTVNKAEYLKMLFLTNGIKPNTNLSANPYDDVPKDSWYAPYAYLTNKRNLLDVNNNRLEADNGMTRGDVAETIYRMIYVMENDLLTYAK